MSFDRKSLVIPDGTRFEERSLQAPGDIILGNHVKIQFGVHTPGRIFAGQNVRIEGDVKTPQELRLDHFCSIDGSVDAGGNVYLGENGRIEGKLTVGGDLDVGDDVAIARGFEAKGWINIRSPVPTVIYLFLYLMELMRLGKSAEVEQLLTEIEASQERIQIRDGFLFVPDGSTIGLTHSVVKGNLFVGKDCRILGNFHVHGSVNLGPGSKLYGAVRAFGPIRVQRGAEVQGTLESPHHITLSEEVRVLGDVRAQTVDLFHSAIVDGRLVAPGGLSFNTRESLAMREKVERYTAGIRDDLIDLLG